MTMLAGASWLAGCNSLFYYPEPKLYLTPARFELPYEDVVIPTEDGEKLAAWRLKAKEPKIGTVVQFHGNAENRSTHFLFVAWLTDAGYDVITFDYRGYGESTGRPTRRGLYLDGLAVLRYASQGESDTFVVAQSLGGAVVMPVLEATKAVRAAVIDSAFASYRAMARDKLAGFFLTWPLQWPLAYLVTDELKPEDAARHVTTPALFFHGDQDRIVPLEQGLALYEALATSDKEFVEIEGGGHTAAFGLEEDTFRIEAAKFFCAHHSDPERCRARFATWRRDRESGPKTQR